MKNKKVIAGIIVGAALLAIMVTAVLSTTWGLGDQMSPVPIIGGEGSLSFGLFETYGPVILALAVLMFGAIIGGVCVAKEKEENEDDSD